MYCHLVSSCPGWSGLGRTQPPLQSPPLHGILHGPSASGFGHSSVFTGVTPEQVHGRAAGCVQSTVYPHSSSVCHPAVMSPAPSPSAVWTLTQRPSRQAEGQSCPPAPGCPMFPRPAAQPSPPSVTSLGDLSFLSPRFDQPLHLLLFSCHLLIHWDTAFRSFLRF